MNQEKIGNFIKEQRKEQNLTQEQLAEKLNISKNAVSKWERGLNLPDVSIMQDLCKILNISLNELFCGEKIPEENYKEAADRNLLDALENSAFTLKDKIKYYKRKWKKDHLSKIILSFVMWIVLIIALILQNAEPYLIGTAAGLLALVFYVILYHQMMIYVENHAYIKIKQS